MHGGLTYAKDCLLNSDIKGYWWLGFDCAHFGDYSPELPFSHGEYRNIEYVKEECKSLADQLIEIAKTG